MRQELSLVCGHVDVDRAIAFAALASEAEIERFFDVLIAPAIGDHISLQHLPEVVSAAARGVH